CRERPCRRAAEQRYELAPFQLIELHSVPAAKPDRRIIELARISQVITERFYNLLAVCEGAHSPVGRERLENQGHRSFASARRPAPVIRRRGTSIRRPPATMRSMLVVANSALISSIRSSIFDPLASMIGSVQPSMDASSNSRARRRCCLVVGIWASGTWALLTKSPRNRSASLLAQSSIYLGPALSTKCNANSLAASTTSVSLKRRKPPALTW